MSQQKPIGVGIIGSGKRGAGLGMLHAQVYPETGFQVVALCDRNAERVNFAAQRISEAYAKHGVTVEPVGCFRHPLLVTHAATPTIGRNSPRHSSTTRTAKDFPVTSDVKSCRNVSGLSTNPACMAGVLVSRPNFKAM